MVALGVNTRRIDDVLVVTAIGEIDISTRLRLSTALNDVVTRDHEPVVIDLAAISFMDSSGLGILLNALRRLVRQQRRLTLVCPPGEVRRVMNLTGLIDSFSVHDELGPAVAEAGRPFPEAAPAAC
jgi:anti-sigma B factor antagonist